MSTIRSTYLTNPFFDPEVKRLYCDENLLKKEVASRLGVSVITVYDSLKRQRIPTTIKWRRGRRDELRVRFFDAIDTEEKAYFLGLWYADGNVGINKRGSYTASIILSSEDSYLLRHLSGLLYVKPKSLCRIPAYISKRKNGRRVKNGETKMLYVYGRDFFDTLVKQGCFPRKSLTLRFPTEKQVPASFLHHFIRGYFDGDGSIGYYLNNHGDAYHAVSIVSSHRFIAELKEVLDGRGIYGHIKKVNNISYLNFSARDKIGRFYDLIYSDATIWMKRKKDIFPHG